MTNDPSLSAQAIVRQYLAHGIAAKVYRGAVVVRREEGWMGPLDTQDLQSTYLEDIARIEADARVAAVVVLCREASGWKEKIMEQVRTDAEVGMPYMWSVQFIKFFSEGRRPPDLRINLGSLHHLLSLDGWDDERATLYASVATRLHWRNELVRELND